MYILFNKNIDRNELINYLHSIGIVNSDWGPSLKESVGICISITSKRYTTLNESMCNPDPHIGWIHCRKRAENIEEFKKYAKNIMEGTEI